MINKKWYLSKIVWVNAIAFVGVMVQTATNKTILTPELQVMALSVVNLVLRTVTKENIIW
ncbi:hypothetical protein [Clostridium sp. CF012]|uniref:hypothetical protein n=1 Tax=Clostridium sp. CF012 TaxID=2843319 RepID=UPI001C0D29A3|nr:hypothetical protein [Clostridium sp. CF012]MBU3144948.1 hypothetical protein [Clostridium sp. CF012]